MAVFPVMPIAFPRTTAAVEPDAFANGWRAASHLGSQHGELAAWRGRVEAVLDQPAGRPQASQRPPRADHVEVDVGAVAGDDVAQVLLVSERQGGEVVQGVALACLGPVDHTGDL